MHRNHTRVVQIGNRVIGGGNPILIQSMTNTPTEDVEATVAQILALEAAGCEIIRCAVPTKEAAKALADLVSDEELNPEYVIPKAFDPRVGEAVAKAVAEAARKTGVARI